jgi:hypothetical protein
MVSGNRHIVCRQGKMKAGACAEFAANPNFTVMRINNFFTNLISPFRFHRRIRVYVHDKAGRKF